MLAKVARDVVLAEEQPTYTWHVALLVGDSTQHRINTSIVSPSLGHPDTSHGGSVVLLSFHQIYQI